MTEAARDIRLDAAQSEPRGTLSIRTLAMPADTNQYGDIFGGWLFGANGYCGRHRCSKYCEISNSYGRGRRDDIPQAGLRWRRHVHLY